MPALSANPTIISPAIEALLVRALAEELIQATDPHTIRDILSLTSRGDDEVLASLLILMFAALVDGGSCLPVDQSRLTERLAATGSGDPAGVARAIVARCATESGDDIIGATVDFAKPLALYRSGGNTFVYFQRFLRQELELRQSLVERVGEPLVEFAKSEASAIRRILEDRSPVASLSEGQQRAVLLALSKRFAIISGGPGSGKTSIAAAILRCLMTMKIEPSEIALAAPTGRAAQRLTDAVNERLAGLASASERKRLSEAPAAVTLHQLLEYSPRSGRFGRDAENPLPFKAVIVDEASMVGLSLLSQVTRSLPRDSRLTLIGDKNQLPSVEVGGWLANLIPDDGAPVYEPKLAAQMARCLPALPNTASEEFGPFNDYAILSENFRSERRIRELAERTRSIGSKAFEELPAFPAQGWEGVAASGGCWLLEGDNDLRAWRKQLQAWSDTFVPTTFREQVRSIALPLDGAATEQFLALFDAANRCRILAATREGPFGAEGINAMIAAAVRAPGDAELFYPGAPIMILRNDHERGLFNGDVGMTLRDPSGATRAAFLKAGRVRLFAVHSLPPARLGYAITIHKSQGSEYDQVMLVAPPDGARRALTRELIYTGLTRARKAVVLRGPKAVFAYAADNVIERASGVFRALFES
jgi:exodeoxyribonuclease V alpha subunit